MTFLGSFSVCYTDLLSAAITILITYSFLIDTLAWIEYYGISNTILIAAKAIAAYIYITLKDLTEQNKKTQQNRTNKQKKTPQQNKRKKSDPAYEVSSLQVKIESN